MTTAALLTVVASLLVGSHVPVRCSNPPGIAWTGSVYGYTLWPPKRIYLRACAATRALRPVFVTVFAHELIHAEHPGWPHPKVYRVAPWYARHVVGRVLRRAEARVA